MDFATLGRAPLRLGLGSKRITSGDLQIIEATEELLDEDIPEPNGVASNVSLLRGFNATIPSAEQSKTRRRQMRNIDTPKLGLKKLGMSARGLLVEQEDQEEDEDDVVIVSHRNTGQRKKGRESLSATKTLGKEELTRQTQEILRDKENIHVRRVRITSNLCQFVRQYIEISQSLVNSEIEEITHKIQALDGIRAKLEQDLLKLHEDELELDDECKPFDSVYHCRRSKFFFFSKVEGVKERMEFEQASSQSQKNMVQNLHLPPSSRRRRGMYYYLVYVLLLTRRPEGPAFLPSEHDELPPGVAFMVGLNLISTADAHSDSCIRPWRAIQLQLLPWTSLNLMEL